MTNALFSIFHRFRAYSATVLTLADQALVSGGNFVINLLLARTLGVDDYGVYALLWMVVLFGLSFHQAYIAQPLASLAPQFATKNEQQAYLGSVHLLQWIVSTAIGLAVALFLMVAGEGFGVHLPSPMLLVIMPLLVMFHLLYDFYRRHCFVQQDMGRALALDSAMYVFQFAGMGGLWWVRNGALTVEEALGAMLVANGAAVVMGLAMVRTMAFDLQALRRVALRHWAFAKWLLGTAALQWLSGNFFILAAAGVLSVAAVGAVRMVQNVMGLTHILFLAMENVVPVKAALHYREGGRAQLRRYLYYITTRAGAVVGGLLIGAALFGEPLIALLYGTATLSQSAAVGLSYQWIVAGFCLTYMLVFLAHPLRFALRTLERTQPIFWAYVVSAVFSVVAAAPLLSTGGMAGLLAGLFITQLLSLMVYIWYLRRV